MADFKNLNVWQKAHRLSIATVEASGGMKGVVGSHLRSQLLRAITSVQANIAEGSAKHSDRDFARFSRIALGSATEAENHVLLARDLKLIYQRDFERLNVEIHAIRKMLTGLIKRLSADASRNSAAQTTLRD